MQVTITDKGDLKAFARAIRKEANGPALRREMAKAMRTELRPVVAEVKAAYRAAPSHGHASATRARQAGPALRWLLARATRQEVRLVGKQAGIRVRVDGRKMPSGQRSLPAMYEGTKRWRHPVFGNRGVWVQQRSPGRFAEITRRHDTRVREALDRIATGVVARIESR